MQVQEFKVGDYVGIVSDDPYFCFSASKWKLNEIVQIYAIDAPYNPSRPKHECIIVRKPYDMAHRGISVNYHEIRKPR